MMILQLFDFGNYQLSGVEDTESIDNSFGISEHF
jgi:hypothetical protein